MSNAERVRPRTLLRAVNDSLRVYGAAAILGFLLIIFIPYWLRWLWFTACGALVLVGILGPFVEDWKPKSRVSVNSKAVLITGCDSGFGHSLALRLDGLGLHVFAACLFPDGEGAKTLKKSASSRLHVLSLDVTSEESVEKAVKSVTQKVKDNKLWAIVNNAGLNDGGELFWTNVDIIQRVIDVNTFGVIRVTKAFLPLLCKSKGRVITVCSAASKYTYSGMVPYCISKQAAKSFCDGLRLEMYRFGVKVVTIEPWMYKTPITNEEATSKYLLKTWEKAPEEVKQNFSEDYIKRHIKNSKKFINYSISDKPQQVVDCLEEAVMAMHPKYSYSPGTVYSRLSFWFLRKLPKEIADLVLNEEFGINL